MILNSWPERLRRHHDEVFTNSLSHMFGCGQVNLEEGMVYRLAAWLLVAGPLSSGPFGQH